MLKLSALVLAVAVAGCGSNQVKIEIRGGDGQLVRLDANDVQYKFNHLVKAGTYVLPEPDSKIELGGGAYAVNVAAGNYMENKVLQVESPPLWGVRTYEAIFDIPLAAMPLSNARARSSTLQLRKTSATGTCLPSRPMAVSASS